MKIFNVIVQDKVAIPPEGAAIVCENSDYFIDFEFDKEWEGHDKKTARFVYNGSYTDVIFTGSRVNIPPVRKSTTLAVGVFAGDLKTTTSALFPCLKSILSDEGLPHETQPNAYQQILNELDDKVDKVDGKGLSTEDYTSEEKDKLSELPSAEELNEELRQISETIEDEARKTNESLSKHIEDSKIYVTASSNTPIYDINRNADNNGIKSINFYGTVSQEKGATLKTPKPIDYPTSVTNCTIGTHYDSYNKYTQTLALPSNVQLQYPFLATNGYKDSGWYDFKSKKIHYKKIIKKVVLDGTETGSLKIWGKASYPEGRYFANLNHIPGLFTDEDLSRIQDDIPIAYDDGKCSIASDYYTNGNLFQSGQFNYRQLISNGVGCFRFQFFAPEFSTLDEVLKELKKNPITLLIPMIYDVRTYTFNYDLAKEIKSYNRFSPLSLYFGGYDASERFVQIPTEVTYQLDVGSAIQNMKNAITALGGKI